VYEGNLKGGIDVGRGQSDPMMELLRSLVGGDALTFTTLRSRYSMLANIIILSPSEFLGLTVSRMTAGKPSGKNTQVKVVIAVTSGASWVQGRSIQQSSVHALNGFS
jgi:hypothetical protein